MAKQDELSKRRRLNKGQCPTHGVHLQQEGVATSSEGIPYGDVMGCPRRDCDFTVEVTPGSRLDQLMRSAIVVKQ